MLIVGSLACLLLHYSIHFVFPQFSFNLMEHVLNFEYRLDLKPQVLQEVPTQQEASREGYWCLAQRLGCLEFELLVQFQN